MSTGQRGSTWRGRPVAAAAAGWGMLLLPSIVGVLVAVLTANLLPPPGSRLAGPVWLVVVLGAAVAAWAAVLWGTRRLAPLPFLLRLTLVFPDDTPSRWKVARQAVQAGPLASRIRQGGVLTDESLPPTAGGVLALVSALEAHDSFTRGHAERVRLYVTLIAEELEVPEDELAKLSWSALLHDIGKLKVPAETLNSTEKLTDEQWSSLQAHPKIGSRLCMPIAPWLGEWIGAVTDHHERWDGKGYPRGLAGEDISLAGRITAVADTFEVMTAGRPYSPPKPPDAARAELVACAGSQFDPEVVRAALQLSLGRSTRLRALVASLIPLPLLRLAEYATPRAWQGATLATGLTAAAVTGVLAAPAPASAPPDAPLAAEAPDQQPTNDEPTSQTLAAPQEADPSVPVAPTPRRPPAPEPTGDATEPPPDTAPDPDAPTPSPVPQPSPQPEPDAQPEPEAEPTQVASHDDMIATMLHLAPARAEDHPAHRVLPLATSEPSTDQPVDGDSDRDANPGITLDRERPTQRWGAAMTTDGLWTGPVELEVFLARPSFTTGPVAVLATLAHCTADGSCDEAATSVLRGRSQGSWTAVGGALALPPGIIRTTEDSRIEIRLSLDPTHGPVWVAPAATSTPSHLRSAQVQPATTITTARRTGGSEPWGVPE